MKAEAGSSSPASPRIRSSSSKRSTAPSARLWIACVARLRRFWVRALRIFAEVVSRRRSPSADSTGVSNSETRSRPSDLRPVHRFVGGDQHRLGAAVGLGAEHRHPDADRRPGQVRIAGEAVGHLQPQVLAQLHRPLDVRLRHQHRELVAGEAGDDVGGAHPFAQGGGDPADQVVALLVAEPVVDPLQPVDVDHHHRAAAAVAGGEVDVGVEAGAEGAAVQQRGERVVFGEIAQLGLGLLRLFERAEDDLTVGRLQFRQDCLRGRRRACALLFIMTTEQ